ncbi:MAG: hypothetical protein E7664_02060 [Ruminococcaceae bacterium]|nr:hypothetical protein [Oscillospiraceae bacterium]
MKSSCEITLRVSEDMLRRFLYVSEQENRTPANQFNFMLRNNIAYFERTKGKIPEAALRSIDIAEYKKEEQ